MPSASDVPLDPPSAAPSAARSAWFAHRARELLIAFVACWLLGRASQAGVPIDLHLPLVWAPAGVALAGLLRAGRRCAPGLWLALFALAASRGLGWFDAALLACGQLAGPYLAAHCLRRGGLRVELDRRRDLAMFGAFAVGAGAAVTASVAALVAWLPGNQGVGAPGAVWLASWFANSAGALLVGIPLLTLSSAALKRWLGGRRGFGSAVLFVATLAGGLPAFAAPAAWSGVAATLAGVAWVALCWTVLRSGLFAGAATALIVFVGACVLQAFGPAAGALPAGLGSVVTWTAMLAAIPLLTSALLAELVGREQRWGLALEASDMGVAEWDLRAGRVFLSRRWLRMLGYSKSSAKANATAGTSRSVTAFWSDVHPDDVEPFQRCIAAASAGASDPLPVECRLACWDGRWAWVEVRVVVTQRAVDGAALRLLAVARDISRRQLSRGRRQVTDNLFQHLREGLVITDAQHAIVEVNPAYLQICGGRALDLLGTVPLVLRSAAEGSAAGRRLAAIRESLASEGFWRGEIEAHRADAEPCVLLVTISAVRQSNGAIANHVMTFADVTQARAQFDRLQLQAHVDELTGLPNRARLAQMMKSALEVSERDGSLLTVCYLDLDRFKPINDTHGHAAGDRLLKDLAARLRSSLRAWAGGDDGVARIGGDEFVLLLRTATVEESRHAVQRVLRKISEPYALGVGAGPTVISASIGATVFPLDYADAETLLRHADHAMYGAKQAGRDGFLFFDAELDRRTEARFVAISRVQEALDADEFRLYYQPKVDMLSNRVLGVEALLRWKHPQMGVVSPAQFLPLIEHTVLSVSVGNWVLARGIEQLARWQRAGLDLSVSINISARHLQEPMFAQNLAALLARHKTPIAPRLTIEVLETAALADIDHTCRLMDECRALGVKVALDDFGTGYSTLTYLKRLPLDVLKIDRSFVMNMLNDRQDLAIIEGVIGLSHTFGCSVVAEGVETAAVAQRLIEIGCRIGQGNGIAAAMPVEEVAGWVRDYRGMAPQALSMPA